MGKGQRALEMTTQTLVLLRSLHMANTLCMARKVWVGPTFYMISVWGNASGELAASKHCPLDPDACFAESVVSDLSLIHDPSPGGHSH